VLAATKAGNTVPLPPRLFAPPSEQADRVALKERICENLFNLGLSRFFLSDMGLVCPLPT